MVHKRRRGCRSEHEFDSRRRPQSYACLIKRRFSKRRRGCRSEPEFDSRRCPQSYACLSFAGVFWLPLVNNVIHMLVAALRESSDSRCFIILIICLSHHRGSQPSGSRFLFLRRASMKPGRDPTWNTFDLWLLWRFDLFLRACLNWLLSLFSSATTSSGASGLKFF